jgi:pre-rRNA-processing protein RIX1
MVVRTLTRVFVDLTREKPTLVREFVTPHLPAFFTGLLGLVGSPGEDGDEGVLAAAIEALRDTIRAHPATFRPFVARARLAVVKLLESGVGEGLEKVGREVFVVLHLCASNSGKRAAPTGETAVAGRGNAVAAEWGVMVKGVVEDVHAALDWIFEPVVEDTNWGHREVLSGAAPIGLEAPGGDVGSRVERVKLLLRIAGSFFTSPTTAQPAVPLGVLVDLVGRICAVTVPSAQANPAIERERRDAMLALLPGMHAAALDLVDTVAHRIGRLILPFVAGLLEQVTYLVTDETGNADLRVAGYTLASTLLDLCGAGLEKRVVEILRPLLSVVCDDLLPPVFRRQPPLLSGKKQKANHLASTAHADSLLSSTVRPTVFVPPGIQVAAAELLTVSFRTLQQQYVRADIRAKLERTAVITCNREALLAAVMFPRPDARVGLLPHLVGAGVTVEVEAVVRPRMPVVFTGEGKDEILRELEEGEDVVSAPGDEEEEEEEEGEDGEMPAAKRVRVDAPPMKGLFSTDAVRLRPVEGEEGKGVSPEKPVPAIPIMRRVEVGGDVEAPLLVMRPVVQIGSGVSPVKGMGDWGGGEETRGPGDVGYVGDLKKDVEEKSEEKDDGRRGKVVEATWREDVSDSGGEMEIPEIVMGEDSDDDED